MPVTFQVVGNLADFGNDARAGVKVRATASPGIKVGDEAVHSNQPETVVTDAAGSFTLELVSLPGVWYRIQTPYGGALPTINLAGYVPDVDDPTTGTAFPPGTVIDVKDVANENPTPGYEAVVFGGNATWAALPDKPTLGTAAATDATAYARTLRKFPLPLPTMVTADPQPVRVDYRPTGLVQATSTVITFADVDAANLKAVVVCPPSGRIRYRLRAAGATGGPNTQGRWALAVNGTTITATIGVSIQATSAAAAPATPTTTEGILKTSDNAGTALVPGTAYTITWQHASGTGGSSMRTEYGGTVGAATMEFTPVVHRITETPMVATESAAVGTGGFGGHVPLWLCRDGVTLLGRGGVGTYISWSTDDGATWTNHSQNMANGAQHIRELDNGEVAVFTEAQVAPGDNASVWVSSGWATDHATATFTKTLVSGKAGTDRIAWREWSMDTYGPIVLAAEYGPKVSRDNMAGQVHLSEDYGQTWRVIFDLADVDKSTGVEAHLHGVKYDPWWDAIWVCNGDFVQNAANWVSFDHGATWTRLAFAHQVTNMFPMPSCVLFVTDTGSVNGIYRLPRTHPANLTVELALTQDAQAGITMLGTQIFQLRSRPGSPVLISADAGGVSGPARLFATYDGYNFREVWTDSQSYVNHGLRTMVGPTATGKYHGRLDRVTNYAENSVVITLSPPP